MNNTTNKGRKYTRAMVLFLCLFFLCACGKEKQDKEDTMQENIAEVTQEVQQSQEETQESNEEAIAEAIRQETTPIELPEDENTDGEELSEESQKEMVEASAEEGPTAELSDKIPSKYFTKRDDHAGTIEHITYHTKDYFGNQSEIEKSAYVYLPYGYSKDTKYNVLYLMHGIGGNEKEWGMYDDSSRVKAMMDNLIYYGDIEPFIVVTPNGRSSVDFANTSSDFNSFYEFGKELRDDLIPYIEGTYSTYADASEEGYDLTQARDHRAMAGLSMGGMQTINIGLCECLDLISYFGAFSAAPTSYEASKIATILKDYPEEEIHYFYNICGTEDSIALASASAAAKNLPNLTDRVTADNFMWKEVSGAHDFNIWYLGFYHFAQLVFK